jgi:chromate reductase
MKILGISGSLREASHNTQLLHAAARLAPAGAELEIVPAALLKAVPPYDQDDDVPGEPPAAVARLRELVEGADAVLVATPEYNSSLPGQLKNALDWLSRPIAESPFRNKPAAVVGGSTGMFGGVWAQEEGRKVLGALGARVIGGTIPFPRIHEGFTAGGTIADDDLAAGLLRLLAELVDEARVRQLAA